MESKYLEYSTDHLFEFDIELMKKILLRKFNKDKYSIPFKNDVTYDIPDVLSSIINLQAITIIKLITFKDDEIEVVCNKNIDILGNLTNTKLKIIYKSHNNNVAVYCKVKVDLQFLPSFIMSLITPIFDYVVETIFKNERDEEQQIFNEF